MWHCVDSTGVGDDQYQETRGIACSGLQRCIKNTRLTPGVLLWFIPIPAGSADHTGRPPAARRRPGRNQRARHIVNGFAFSAGGFRHQTHFGRDITFDIQLRQGDRQPNAVAQRGDGLYFVHRRIFQHQLRQGSERHFFPVIIVMGVRDGRYAVMNRVRRRETTAFETHAAQIGVGFHHPLQRRGDHVLFGGQHRFFTLFE